MKRMASAKGSRPTDAQKKRTLGELAENIERLTQEIDPDVELFGSACRLISDSWSSKMYWHDSRGSANDLMASSTPETMASLRGLAAKTEEQSRQRKAQFAVWEGYADQLDQAIASHFATTERLAETSRAFINICDTVEHFWTQRSGVRGWLRRRTRKSA